MSFQALSLIAFEPLDRSRPPVFAQLTGEPVVPDIPGGWQSIDRPKRRDMTDWKGQGLKQITLPCMFDGFRKSESVEGNITGMYLLIEGNGTTPAPVITITGLAPLTHLKWGLNGIAWGDYERRTGDGARIRQMFTATLLEYVAPDIAVTTAQQASPAQQAAAKATTGSSRTYTVRSGDTLSSIAASQLGDYRRWPEIGGLNGIRDPKSLKVGQVLRLP